MSTLAKQVRDLRMLYQQMVEQQDVALRLISDKLDELESAISDSSAITDSNFGERELLNGK